MIDFIISNCRGEGRQVYRSGRPVFVHRAGQDVPAAGRSRRGVANGTAERRAWEIMLKARRKAAGRRITAGEDKAYDTADHFANLCAIGMTLHVTQIRPSPKPARTAPAPSTNKPRGIRDTAYRNAPGDGRVSGWTSSVAAVFMLNLIV